MVIEAEANPLTIIKEVVEGVEDTETRKKVIRFLNVLGESNLEGSSVELPFQEDSGVKAFATSLLAKLGMPHLSQVEQEISDLFAKIRLNDNDEWRVFFTE